MSPRTLFGILAVAVGAPADTGAPSHDEARVVPFIARQDSTGASLLGALDLDRGSLLWAAPLDAAKKTSFSLAWHGVDVHVTASSEEAGRRTSLRNLLDGRPRLDLAGGWFLRVRCGDRLLLLDLQQEPSRAVDGRTGAELWSRPGSSWGQLLARVPSPLVLFHVDGRLTAVDALDGRERWTRETGENAYLHTEGRRAWLHTPGTPVVAELDPDTGRDARTVQVGAPIDSLSIDASRLFLCLSDRVIALQVADLSTLWTWRTEERPTSVWAVGNTLIVEHPERRKSILDARTGERTGVLAYQKYKSSSASLGLPGLYIFQVDGHTEGPQVRILNTATGKILWEGADARVYTGRRSTLVALRRGKELSRLDPVSGADLWTVPTDPILASLIQRHRLVLIRGRHATALDPIHGKELWRIELPFEATWATFGWESPD